MILWLEVRYTDNDSRFKSLIYVVKVSYGRRSQVADGHLGRAQVADAQRIGHIGLGSNFQPSLIWLMHILNYLYL